MIYHKNQPMIELKHKELCLEDSKKKSHVAGEVYDLEDTEVGRLILILKSTTLH